MSGMQALLHAPERFVFCSERLGPWPLINHFIERIGLPEHAPMGVPGKARGRRALLCARTSNAARRAQRGVLGCSAL